MEPTNALISVWSALGLHNTEYIYSSFLHFLDYSTLIMLKTITFLFCFWLYQENSASFSYKECLSYYICSEKVSCLWVSCPLPLKAVQVAILALRNSIYSIKISKFKKHKVLRAVQILMTLTTAQWEVFPTWGY